MRKPQRRQALTLHASDIVSMTYKEFIRRFSTQILSLNYSQQLTLAVNVSKKLYFDYLTFSQKYQWGDKEVLLEAINIIEQSRFAEVSQSQIELILTQIDAVTPDMDEFGSDYLGSYALNACVAVYNSIQFIADKHSKHIYDIGICLTDTVDFKLKESKQLREEEIDNNPLMIEARRYLLGKAF